MSGTQTRPESHLRELRETRRNPRVTYFLYLHCRRLRDDLATAIAAAPRPIEQALDVFCGVRPYEDLLPPGARCTGFDVDESYGPGVADVVSTEFLPFEDESYDLVLCTQAFYFIQDSAHAAAEFLRVLRPGGTALVSTPLVWPYQRESWERRFTGPQLEELFADWEGVELIENGGRGTSWATLTAHLIHTFEAGAAKRLRASPGALFAPLYVFVNTIGLALDALERRFLRASTTTLPQNLLLSARKPS